MGGTVKAFPESNWGGWGHVSGVFFLMLALWGTHLPDLSVLSPTPTPHWFVPPPRLLQPLSKTFSCPLILQWCPSTHYHPMLSVKSHWVQRKDNFRKRYREWETPTESHVPPFLFQSENSDVRGRQMHLLRHGYDFKSEARPFLEKIKFYVAAWFDDGA